jgi:hypothetical protein
MVRPDLRRDMVDIPKISGPQGRERERERERTLREDWPIEDGSWRHAGVEEVPCELVREWCFLGLRVPAKQLRSWRKGMGVERERERDGIGEAGRARSVLGMHPDPSHSTKC